MTDQIIHNDGQIVAIHHDRDGQPPTTSDQAIIEASWPEGADPSDYHVVDGELANHES